MLGSSDTKLSSKITVSEYLEMVKKRDTEKIAEFIKERFKERYIDPFENNTSKHGFSMMAVSCLMIEALESFKQGWPNSNSKSALAFCYFFDKSNNFSEFKGKSQEFYKHVRCGLLHQAETTGGWRIIRKGPLFDGDTNTINATKFLKGMKDEIEEYSNQLKKADWDNDVWVKLRKKMKHICKNTKA